MDACQRAVGRQDQCLRTRICNGFDVHQTYLPLFHTNALAYSMLASLWCRRDLRDPATLLGEPVLGRWRSEHGSTWTSTIPFCMKALLEHEVPKHHKFRLWGTAVNEPPPFAVFGIKIIGWWGMTETITHGIIGRGRPAEPADVDRPRRARNTKSASPMMTAPRPASARPAIS